MYHLRSLHPPAFTLFLQMKKRNRAIGDIKQREIIESVTSLDLNTKGGISLEDRARILTATLLCFWFKCSNRQDYFLKLFIYLNFHDNYNLHKCPHFKCHVNKKYMTFKL